MSYITMENTTITKTFDPINNDYYYVVERINVFRITFSTFEEAIQRLAKHKYVTITLVDFDDAN